ncbi:acyl-CoA thioester hydrolase/BAAT C-terminal domain-containing protein [Yeosuana sp. MJ-SS3]|uniref:Acyl-CoA thioester hydrolase/BAAT C-terminal domain-containing protein n=1 Tax=Gilvirhabdus luticola TaxID=3079858 RepID=A0ABU3U601_9FLAO|nr:acyl-CoA thioester hydrolase/BAAT C-terminal domain-containing protein [Yeosuana sp. MJ-SS3]MDU8885828.1 acyl-CoA thioester hydrolase/BAAT C-terminal domain-containing protein [Yeosuana sp. MJ-SS3]
MKRVLKSRWFLIPAALILCLLAFLKYYYSFDGRVQKVTFTSNNHEIEGAIIRPNKEGPLPAVVILHGSGGSHQEYNKMFNKLHANEFTKRGFAVLCYTKRGSGKNNVNYDHVDFNDLIGDALSAINFLKTQPDIDPNNIGIFALSESGWFSPEIAEKSGSIKFIINRVGTPLDWRKTVIHEVRKEVENHGLTEQEIEEVIVPITLRRWQFYIDASKNNSAVEKERIAINKQLKEMSTNERFSGLFAEKLPEFDAKIYAAKAQKYSYDPGPFIKRINIPMLYILGETDINIPTVETIEELEMLKESYQKDITIKTFPNTGHYMYRYDSLPIEGLYQEGYLDLIGNWAKQQVKN